MGSKCVSEDLFRLRRPLRSIRETAHRVGQFAAFCALLSPPGFSFAQDAKAAADQNPKTAPATAQILSSFEGQNVTAIEIAGRPEFDTSKFAPLFVQHAGEPFSKAKVDQTVAALKTTGKFDEVQLQVDPEADGVRVLMILEPAVWFGIFEFP